MNQRPSGYEPDELPDCSTPQYVSAPLRKKRIYAPMTAESTMWRVLHNSRELARTAPCHSLLVLDAPYVLELDGDETVLLGGELDELGIVAVLGRE